MPTQEIYPNSPEELLASVLNNLTKTKPFLNRCYRHNAGLFWLVPSAWADNPAYLALPEKFLLNLIREKLNRQDTVQVVGLGEMMALSLVRVATHFREQIQDRRLLILATNLEPEFTPERGIAESKRRFEALGGIENWERLGRAFTYLWTSYQPFAPIMPTPAALKFYKENYHLVRFIPGIDTLKLPDITSAVDILHEHFGGLHHHPCTQQALEASCQVMAQEGVIMTSADVELPQLANAVPEFLTPDPFSYKVFRLPN